MECGRPNCNRAAEKPYTGPNGNELELCPECYFRQVTLSSEDSEDGDADYNVFNTNYKYETADNSTSNLDPPVYKDLRTDELYEMDRNDCLHEQLERSRPENMKGNPHMLVCNCPKCRITC